MKPLARYAALNSYVELGRSLGLDPTRLIREAGLDPAGLSLQDRWVPADAVADLLERSAVEAGCDDFGLRLAERRRFANLGPLSLVIREEPDVRSALTVMSRHEHMYNEALHIRLTENNGIATIRLALDLGQPERSRQAIELAVGVLHGLLRAFLGTGWQPVEVRFTHAAPRDRRTHYRVLGPNVAFEQDFNGILACTTDLDARNTMSDPQLRAYTQQFFDSVRNTHATTTLDRVRELIELLLPTGRCSVDQVARSLGLDRRTIHRHLAAEGETFTSLLDSTRAELARHMVANHRHSLTEIAELLGFSSLGNFSRWFRNQFGCSPRQWRTSAPDISETVVGPGLTNPSP
ncbi:AraC family transcriptional regulator [Nocardia sp. NBC_00508]|uniref:AraC family transcriptional regulator n=1 Tax=Nocardia sp. NBC_00508 TaxID=2975992 RepID=UPI002E810CE1|nr:AraC family transcriptional regulator [Nocardia sp. NBC_00508]WUD66653.1 AraC family transcriptional regulator [Nocardia sp. NBC_00508]